MITNETTTQEYTDPKPVSVSEIGTIGTGTDDLMVSAVQQDCMAGEQLAETNRSTPHTLPKTSGVPRCEATIQTETSEGGTRTEVTTCVFQSR